MIGTRRRLPPLGAVRAFEAAARPLRFSRAAEELCVTHGAIGDQVVEGRRAAPTRTNPVCRSPREEPGNGEAIWPSRCLAAGALGRCMVKATIGAANQARLKRGRRQAMATRAICCR
jgi:hypothetical protein